MPAISRSWVSFAAVGAGLIHLSLVLGAALPLGIVLAILGLAEFGWGVLAFSRETLPAPRAVAVAAVVPVLAWVVLLAIGGVGASLGLIPLAVASLFELFIAATIAVHLRRAGEADAPAPPPSVGRYLLGLAVGALTVAALTTGALAAASAGPGHPIGFDLPDHDGH